MADSSAEHLVDNSVAPSALTWAALWAVHSADSTVASTAEKMVA